jgi:hypothetical protein
MEREVRLMRHVHLKGIGHEAGPEDTDNLLQDLLLCP